MIQSCKKHMDRREWNHIKTVKQVSELTGISVRTLQYYDEIGLLAPTKLTDSGYRLYDDAALGTLQQILFFKELDFSLKEIMREPYFTFEYKKTSELLVEMKEESVSFAVVLVRVRRHCRNHHPGRTCWRRLWGIVHDEYDDTVGG